MRDLTQIIERLETLDRERQVDGLGLAAEIASSNLREELSEIAPLLIAALKVAQAGAKQAQTATEPIDFNAGKNRVIGERYYDATEATEKAARDFAALLAAQEAIE